MSKIKLYSPSGGSIEVDDTPRRRRWAKGKGYSLDKPPVKDPAPEPDPGHTIYQEPDPEEG